MSNFRTVTYLRTCILEILNSDALSFDSFFYYRRQKESEAKSIEDAANKRIEELVAQRVAEELERRRDEIEAEVLRRVEEAKKVMEAEMLQEMERRKQEQIEEAKRREVGLIFLCLSISTSLLLTTTKKTSSISHIRPHDRHCHRQQPTISKNSLRAILKTLVSMN